MVESIRNLLFLSSEIGRGGPVIVENHVGGHVTIIRKHIKNEDQHPGYILCCYDNLVIVVHFRFLLLRLLGIPDHRIQNREGCKKLHLDHFSDFLLLAQQTVRSEQRRF